MGENTYAFDLPERHKSIIKVFGVGGAGCNVIDLLIEEGGIVDVELVACDTDVGRLNESKSSVKIQLEVDLIRGSNSPFISKDQISELLSHDTKMLAIVAGLGGRTGSAAAPIIAEIAREAGILTLAVITIPFIQEKGIYQEAIEAMWQLREFCDSVIVIPGDSANPNEEDVRKWSSEAVSESYIKLNGKICDAVKSFTEIITIPGYVNVDFEDVRTVLSQSKYGISSSATASGENRAKSVATQIINSTDLRKHNFIEAHKLILSITSGEEAELQMDELVEITDAVQEFAGDEAEVIFGHGVNVNLGSSLKASLIWCQLDSIFLTGDNISGETPEEINISIDHGNAPTEIVAELLANLSLRYELMNGGSGLNFEFLDVTNNQSVQEEI